MHPILPRARRVAVLAFRFALLCWLVAPATALAAFCTGKQNGFWCDGNNLVLCKSGAASSSQSCPNGCASMPAGTDDKCKDATGFCAGKQNGLWCDGDKLVNCQGNNIAGSQTCANGCQSMPPGTPDKCKDAAPTGFCSGKADGWWCEADGLVRCQAQQKAETKACANGCQAMPDGQDDKCKDAAPSGFCAAKQDGLWCDGDKLVTCGGGGVKSTQPCTSGCQAMPDGQNDKCKDAGPSGFCAAKQDGLWCDGDKLVTCGGGSVKSSQTCSEGCLSMPPGTPDKCKEAAPTGFCAGKANGWWCEGDGLTYCQAQQKTSTKPCSNGCQQMPDGVDDACKSSGGSVTFCSGKQNGLWCDGDKLTTCNNGLVAANTACGSGCMSNPPGVPDACKSSGGTGGNGTAISDGKLQLCQPFAPPKPITCAFGCYDGHKGSDYAAVEGTPVFAPTSGEVIDVVKSFPGQTCTPSFGNYVKIKVGEFEVFLAHLRSDILVSKGPIQAGQALGFVSNSGYTLTVVNGKWVCQQGGGHHLHLEVRKAGVAVDITGSHVAWTACEQVGVGGGAPEPATFCTSKQNGLWCEGDALVSCQNGSKTGTSPCPAGCQSNPPGVPDACKAAQTGPCAGKDNGAWCDGGNLLQCQGGAVASKQACPNGCQSNAAGVPDACKPNAGGPCDGKGNQWFCDAKLLHVCVNNGLIEQVACAHACGEVEGKAACLAPQKPDACQDQPNGAHCQGDILWQCAGGKTAAATPCAFGCGKLPNDPKTLACLPALPAGDDACALQPDGAVCVSAAIRACAAGKTVSLTPCANGCVVGAPVCAAADGGDTCAGLADGWHCDGASRRRCQGGKTAELAGCAFGCTGGAGAASCLQLEAATCAKLGDGSACAGSVRLACANGLVQSATMCQQGCAMSGGVAQCQDAVGFCADKVDGAFCSGSQLVLCFGQSEVKTLICKAGCIAQPGALPDHCGTLAGAGAAAGGFCGDKGDGEFCDGSFRVRCHQGLEVQRATCELGCAGKGPEAVCVADADVACQTLADGPHCHGATLLACKGGAGLFATACLNGCAPSGPAGAACVVAGSDGAKTGVVVDASGCAAVVGQLQLAIAGQNQLAVQEALGACPGRTVASHGDLITTLSVVYASLGAPRDVFGISGNSPALENVWRQQHDGYDVCANGGGRCCARWDRNPGAISFDVATIPDGACLDAVLAVRIAASLAAGQPLVVGAHAQGNPSLWRFLNVVGVGADGLLVLDPRGGTVKALATLDGVAHYLDFAAMPRDDGLPTSDLKGAPIAANTLPGGPGLGLRSGLPSGGDVSADAGRQGQPGSAGGGDSSAGCAASGHAEGGSRNLAPAALMACAAALLLAVRRRRSYLAAARLWR